MMVDSARKWGGRSDIPGWIWINQVSITGAMLKLCLLIDRPPESV